VNALIAGGGTGGHVFPALAMAEALRARGATVRFVGAEDGPEATMVPAADYPFTGVRVISAQTRLSPRTIRAVGLILRAAWQVRGVVRGSDVVISIGGFASAPATLAALFTRRPVVIVEPNAIPGVVNRITARWAVAAATAFTGAADRLPTRLRVVRTGTPIRPEIAAVTDDRSALRASAIAAFDLAADRTTVLVTGGSQGALSLDRAVAGVLGELAGRDDVQLLVSTGPAHLDVVRDRVDPSAELMVRAVAFIERMDLALAVADLAVGRSGGSVAELAACRIPAILVPYPYATEGHQAANARELEELGAATAIDDRDLTPSALTAAILELVDDEERRTRMAAAMGAWGRTDAATAIAIIAEEVAR